VRGVSFTGVPSLRTFGQVAWNGAPEKVRALSCAQWRGLGRRSPPPRQSRAAWECSPKHTSVRKLDVAGGKFHPRL